MSDNAVRREISSFMLSYLGVSPRTPQTIEPSRALVLTYIKRWAVRDRTTGLIRVVERRHHCREDAPASYFRLTSIMVRPSVPGICHTPVFRQCLKAA